MLLLAAVAGGKGGLSVPANESAGDQYVETLPTTKGPRAPGRKRHRNQLPPAVAKKLQRLGGSDAATLEALATSPGLGAPVSDAAGKAKRSTAARRKDTGSHDGRARSAKRREGSGPALSSAAISAAGDGEGETGWLVIAILGITAVSLGAVGYRRRRHKGSAE